MKKIILFMTMSLLIHTMLALDVPKLTLPIMPKAPFIDGKINENEWQYAGGMYGTCSNRLHPQGSMYAGEMSFYVGGDENNLYIAVKRAVGPKKLLNRVMPNVNINPDTFSDDSIETVIIPDLDVKDFLIVHSNINQKGAVYKIAKSKNNMIPFDGKWNVKGTVDDKFWQFEMSISWKDLGLKQMPKRTGLRICMNWKKVTNDLMQTSWEPKKTTFFSDVDIPEVIWKKDSPVIQVGDVRILKSKKVQASTMTIFNPSNEVKKVKLLYEYKPSANSPNLKQNNVYEISPKEKKEIKLDATSVLFAEKVLWRLHVTSVDSKEIYYIREYIFDPYESKDVFLKADANRDDSSRIIFDFAHYPSYKKMIFRANISAVDDKKIFDNIKILLKHGNKVIAELKYPKAYPNGEAYLYYSTPDFEKMVSKGKTFTTFDVEFLVNDKVAKKQSFEYHKFPWQNNALGKSDLIVPPFIGVKGNANNVQVLLRDYQLSSIGLPKQIIAKGEKILKDNGIILEAIIDGKKYIATGKNEVVEHGKSFLKTKSNWSAGDLKGKTFIEFDQDGMFKLDLKILPTATVNSLKLVIPIDNSLVDLMHTASDGARINSHGAVPKGENRVWDSSKIVRRLITNYVPYIWLGSDELGLSVFGSNDRGWVVDAEKVPEFELIRKDGTLYLVLNLFAKTIKLEKERNITLGFMATPVKQMAKNFRRHSAWAHHFGGKSVAYNMTKDNYFDYSVNFIGSGFYFGAKSAYSDVYPVNEDFNYLKEMAKARKTKICPNEYINNWFKKNNPNPKDSVWSKMYLAHLFNGFFRAMSLGNETLFYFNARGMRFKTSPEGRMYLNEWYHLIPADREVMDEVGYDLVPVSSYVDYALYYYKKILETGAMDQMYWDDVFIKGNTNPIVSDAYFREDGTIQPGTDIFEMRNLIKRAAVMMVEMGRDPHFMIHMTSTNLMPVLSYADSNFDWEENFGYADFQERYPREYIRTMSHGRQSGNFPVMLVSTTSEPGDKYDHWIRTASGVLLTHELRWHKNYDEFWSTLKLLFDNGYATKTSKEYNYWQKDYPIAITGGKTSSLVSTDNGKAIIMVCDWEENDGEFTIKLDREKLGIPKTFIALNAETNQKLEVKNDTVSFKLKKHDFIIITIK